MKSRGWITAAVVAACCAGRLGRSVLGDEPTKAPAGGGGADVAKRMGEMMRQMATPGEQHQRLARALEGEWLVTGSGRGLDGSTVETSGTSSFKSILGGRYLAQEMHAKTTCAGGDVPFEGQSILGYDNATKQFIRCSIHNMGTGFTMGSGEETDPGRAWTFHSAMNTPTGEMKSRDEIKVTGDRTFTFTLYMSTGPGQPEAPVMELAYTRK